MNALRRLAFLFAIPLSAFAELRVPAFTAYVDPNPNGASISAKSGLTGWTDPAQKIVWFGHIATPGKLTASVHLRLPKDAVSQLRLSVGAQKHDATAQGTDEGQTLAFGTFDIPAAGTVRFELTSANPPGHKNGDLEALVLDGPAIEGAHFNLDPRRNAASVHLNYAVPKDLPIASFYNEVTAVEDPIATFYMACGFSRGYFGMQVNSATERRIIFSVWDSGAGQTADRREQVSADDHVQLLAKGDDVVTSVFGGEGTGGHSHLKVGWETGSVQKFVVTAQPEGTLTDYAGYWLHPEKNTWQLIAKFRAPNDGKPLRGLHSFSENFSGSNGHLPRKALYGPAWIRTADGPWQEITRASFSHDGTGKSNRLDRFMGVENGRFFLAHGGFLPGFSKFGESYTRPTSGPPPVIQLPETIAPR